MVIISKRSSLQASMGVRFRPVLALLQNLFIPPICLACRKKRWHNTPLCLTCLKQVKPLHRELGEGRDDSKVPDVAFEEFPFSKAYFLFRMTSELSGLVHGFKYRHFRRHIPFLCEYLRFRPDVMEALLACDGIVAVPIHSIRRRERGYNQAEIIALALSRLSGRPVLAGVLSRIRHTTSQTKLTKQARGLNLQAAFACNQPDGIIGQKVILVDDVFTTGATVSQCAALLLKAGCISVEVLALAKVDPQTAKDDFSLDMDSFSGYLA